MLEKLNDEVELYKLHVKHYHMSPAQFRRRTSMLGLPGEIYDKYDKIFRTCRVCSTSVPTPPRATRLCHAITYASCQGLTLRGRVWLCDADNPHFSVKHLYVGASRATSAELLSVL